MNVTHEEIVNLMQSRFPKEFGLHFGYQNQKAMQQIAELSPHNLRNRREGLATSRALHGICT